MTPRLALAGFVAAMALFQASSARADISKDECIDANTRGQDLVHDGKLTAARARLQTCAVPACPAVLRNDCTRRLDELEKLEPAIVFEAKDSNGNDLVDVSVSVDGVPLTTKLVGTPLRVDPGPHVFTFTATGRSPLTKRLVLAERDQARRERVVLTAVGAAAGPAGAVVETVTPVAVIDEGRAPAAPSRLSTRQQLGLVSGGVGVVGLGVGAVFGVLTGSAWSDQKADCASVGNCANHGKALSDHAAIDTDSAVATTAFIAGGVFLAAGAALFFTGKTSPAKSSEASGLVLVPTMSKDGSGLVLRGTF